MKQLAILLFAFVIVLGLITYTQKNELDIVRPALASAQATNKANEEAIATYKEFQDTTNNLVTLYQADRKEIDGLRRELRNGIQRLLQNDEEFRNWASGLLPADAVRMYNEARANNAVPNAGK